jgi:hypothetical protein
VIKDLEQTFGMLQTSWDIVLHPISWDIITAFSIAHNMIVEDEHDYEYNLNFISWDLFWTLYK